MLCPKNSKLTYLLVEGSGEHQLSQQWFYDVIE